MIHDETSSDVTRLRSSYFLPLFVADLIFFSTTNPLHSHVWVFAAGGVLAAVTIWAIGVLFARFLAHLVNISRRGQRLLSAVITIAGLYILGMQSIGQLNARDALALVPLVVVFYFYATYARKAS